MRKYVSNECINCVTYVDGLVVRTINNKTATRYEHFSGQLPKFSHHLREWGEAGIVTTRDIKTSKLTNKGVLCMFVGYSPKHSGDCYRMFNPETKKIHVTRDIRWLDKMFYTKEKKSIDKSTEKKVRFKTVPEVFIDPLADASRDTPTVPPNNVALFSSVFVRLSNL